MKRSKPSFFLAFANIVMAAVPVFAFVAMGYADVAHAL